MGINLFSLSGLLLACTCFILLLLIARNLKSHTSRIWALFNIAVGIWGIGAFFAGQNDSPDKIIFWLKFAHLGIIFIPVFFLHFACLISETCNPYVLLGSYLQGSIFLILILTTDLFFSSKDVRLVFNSFYFPIAPNCLYLVFVFFWISQVILGHYFLLKKYLRSSVFKRNQILYLFLGMLVGFSGGITNFFLPLGILIYPLGNFTIPLYCIIVTYAILKYQLLDIKLTVTRAGLFIGVYTLVLGLPFAMVAYFRNVLTDNFGVNWWIIPLSLMAVLATFGPFLYFSLQRRAENRLLREQKRYQDTLKNAAIGMTRIRDLRKLLSMIVHIVTKTVRISFAAIYLLDEESNEYVLHVSRGVNKSPLQRLDKNASFIKRLIKQRDPIIYEEIKGKMQDSGDNVLKAMEANMRSLGASVLVPSFLDHKLMGFLILGDKLSGQIYTADDLNVFQVLASQAALAIENAQFYSSAKEMQAQIAQAEKMATIGTMADGLSHQINNRFYALSLIAGDSLDTIKMTDTAGCSPEVKSMINQICAALERIQVNVIQGGEVVKGILKYTRKGDEGLEPLTLDQVLDGTIDMVQFKVKLAEIDIVRDYPKDNPRFKGNLVQMQEVFFNFIDNAYDSIVERRNILKEEGYRGKIIISARPDKNIMRIAVKDNGLGVKNEDIKKIFTPFFTTKASSRKGTGLGLYVIRTIITDTHKGNIAFSSEYRNGTTFIVEIPLAA